MAEPKGYLDVECNYQDVMTCAHCGEDIEEGEDRVVWEPEPEYGPNAIVPVHPWCAVRDGYRLRYDDDPPPVKVTPFGRTHDHPQGDPR